MPAPINAEEIKRLLPYAETSLHEGRLQEILEHGSVRKAAEVAGLNKSAYQQTVDLVRRKAALQGDAPQYGMTHPAPDGFTVKGVSTLYDEEGNQRAQWVKTSADHERRLEIMKAVAESLSQGVERLPLMPAPDDTLKDICNVYTMTDCHMGMLAWHREGGADWDVKIAEKTLTKCFERMVANSPAASHCIINQMGDFLHSDGLIPVTPTSGHVLDQDGRFEKVVAATIGVLRHLVDFALQKHDTVHIVMAEGNHDLASSVWLRAMFKALYEKESRVTVDESVLPYYAHQWGKVMIGIHHGHMKKGESLPLFFASEYPEIWGNTRKRYCHTGHRHHRVEKEFSGMTSIQHSTLAARDAHASRHGYQSERQARSITYHKEYGEYVTTVVTPEMIE